MEPSPTIFIVFRRRKENQSSFLRGAYMPLVEVISFLKSNKTRTPPTASSTGTEWDWMDNRANSMWRNLSPPLISMTSSLRWTPPMDRPLPLVNTSERIDSSSQPALPWVIPAPIASPSSQLSKDNSLPLKAFTKPATSYFFQRVALPSLVTRNRWCSKSPCRLPKALFTLGIANREA